MLILSFLVKKRPKRLMAILMHLGRSGFMPPNDGPFLASQEAIYKTLHPLAVHFLILYN